MRGVFLRAEGTSEVRRAFLTNTTKGYAKVKLYVKRKLRSNVAGSASRRTPFREF